MIEEYEKYLENMLCLIQVCPPNHSHNWSWKIYSHHSVDTLKKRPANEKDHIAIYDLVTKKWVQINLDYINTIEFPFFNKYTHKIPIKYGESEFDFDVITREIVEYKPEITDETITPAMWIESGCDHRYVNKEMYDQKVKNFISEIKCKPQSNPWMVNFSVNLFGKIKWKEYFMSLYEELPIDLSRNDVNMKTARASWQNLMRDKAADAGKFLNSETVSLTDELKVVKKTITIFKKNPDNINIDEQKQTFVLIHDGKEEPSRDLAILIDPPGGGLMDTEPLKNGLSVDTLSEVQELLEEQIEEIDVILQLINDQTQEYIDIVEDCDDVFTMKDIWPPILLPMPFKWPDPEEQ